MPFIVEVVAGPSAGKTTLIRRLAPRLRRRGLHVLCLGNRNRSVRAIREEIRTRVKRLQLHKEFAESDATAIREQSIGFRWILLELNARAQSAHQDIILLEHGKNYTYVIEVWGSEIEDYVVESELACVAEPDLVIYIEASPEELRQRQSTKLLWDEEKVKRICRGLEEQRRSLGKHWLLLKGGSPRSMADFCIPKILERYCEKCAGRVRKAAN
ncbi:MAG: hypothetical protein KGJ13_00935 [Patescibacteria group bacterium]|nr:hypothetical protein [Patescibacteria group bacterium]